MEKINVISLEVGKVEKGFKKTETMKEYLIDKINFVVETYKELIEIKTFEDKKMIKGLEEISNLIETNSYSRKRFINKDYNFFFRLTEILEDKKKSLIIDLVVKELETFSDLFIHYLDEIECQYKY